MVLNCDAGATNALSHPLTINATLFTDNYINTATNRFSASYFTSVVQLRFDIIHNKRICYVMQTTPFRNPY